MDNEKSLELLELFADLEHDSWSRWMIYLFSKSRLCEDGSMVIPPDLVRRWKRQSSTQYDDLTEREKESDRIESRKFLAVLSLRSLNLI